MWLYNNIEFTSEMIEDYVGFVYCITNLENNKKYIGKKNFYFSKKLPITKKRKRAKRTKIESDWQDYCGSSNLLLSDIQSLGREKFKREILYLCHSKGEMSYREAEKQFELKVLLYPDLFYNNIINCRIHGKHVTKIKPS